MPKRGPGRPEEREQYGKRTGVCLPPTPDGDNHHHVWAGSHLPHAVQMDQLLEVEPLMDIHRKNLEFGKGRHAAANGEQRQVSENTKRAGIWLIGLHCSLCSAIMTQNREHADADQRPRHRPVKTVHGQHRDQDEDKVVSVAIAIFVPTAQPWKKKPTAAAATPFNLAVTMAWSP